MVGNDESIAEDWICHLSVLRQPPRLLEPPHRSRMEQRPRYSTLPVLWGEACGEVMSEGEGDGVLGLTQVLSFANLFLVNWI